MGIKVYPDGSKNFGVDFPYSKYEENRLLLLKHNLVIHEVIKLLKKLYSELLTKQELSKFLAYTLHPDSSKFSKPLKILSNDINIFWLDIFKFMYPKKIHKINNIFPNIEFIKRGYPKIYRSGLYVRFDPLMTKEDWLKEYDHASIYTKLPEVNDHFYPFFDKNDFWLAKKKLQVSTKDESENIPLYLDIEKRITSYFYRKKIKSGGQSVIDAALEQYVFNSDIDEADEDRLKQEVKTVYYEVAKRYMLPTLKDLKKYIESTNKAVFLHGWPDNPKINWIIPPQSEEVES